MTTTYNGCVLIELGHVHVHVRDYIQKVRHLSPYGRPIVTKYYAMNTITL